MKRVAPICVAGIVMMLLAYTRLSEAAERAATLSLEDYTERAIVRGLNGRENALTFESAGYAREVAFRRTDSPSLSADATVFREGDQTPAGETTSDVRQAQVNFSQLLPTGTRLNAEGEVVETSTNGLGTSVNSTRKNFTASASQPIYIFVKNAVMRTRRQADLTFANAKDSYESTRLLIRSQARTLYYQVMLGEESIKVEQRKVESAKKPLDITQALVKGGKTAPVETMRAKIRFQTDERQLQNALTNRAKAVLNAKNFIYMPLESDIYFISRLQFKPLEVPLERLHQYAMIHNPQLRILNRQKELARLDMQIAREVTRPTLSLDTTYRYSDLSPSWIRNWTLGGSTHWLFFDSFITRNNVNIARIDVLIADINYSEAERTVQLNINNAYLDIKNAERQIQDFSASIEQARHNVDVLRLRFRSGLERLIDVFDAENDMRDLDNQYLNLLVSFNQLKDSLSQLVGTDVETLK